MSCPNCLNTGNKQRCIQRICIAPVIKEVGQKRAGPATAPAPGPKRAAGDRPPALPAAPGTPAVTPPRGRVAPAGEAGGSDLLRGNWASAMANDFARRMERQIRPLLAATADGFSSSLAKLLKTLRGDIAHDRAPAITAEDVQRAVRAALESYGPELTAMLASVTQGAHEPADPEDIIYEEDDEDA